jgi:membrane-associated phospholipid phosphatase
MGHRLRTCCVRVTLCFMAGALASHSVAAQFQVQPSSKRFWMAGAALLGASLALDERIRVTAERQETPALDRLARDVDPLGRARYLIPSLAAAYVVPRLTGRRGVADAVLRIGLGYAAADGFEAALKPAVGRHRPDSTARPFRFRPLNSADAWHSFPSAHAVHAFAIAAGVSDEWRDPLVAAVAYGTATMVGLQRVYTRAHWMSDVVGSALLAIGVSHTVTRWFHRRQTHRLSA